MAKANRSKTGAQRVTVASIETALQHVRQAQSVALLASSDNACDEATHREAAGAIVESLERASVELRAMFEALRAAPRKD